MTDAPVHLRALGWDHPRCLRPMEACTEEWRRQRGAEITWDARSLTAFGDQPLEEIADRYDLLVIDHPFCGRAAAAAALWPLDQLLAADTLGRLADDAIGPSHGSYSLGGSQWALATDAACQVAAFRPDLLSPEDLPHTWDQVHVLASANPGRIALPLTPAHAICSFLTLCANAGSPAASAPGALVDQEIGLWALDLLGGLAALGPPAAFESEPPDILEVLTTTNELLYVPLTFGYVSYSRADEREPTCRFVDIPSAGGGPVGSVLGGAGLAVSATSQHPDESVRFAAWASGADAQRTVVGPAGGQPGSRAAWTDPGLDETAEGFFSGTLATIESAWVRPRDAWWPAFQLEAGCALANGLAAGAEPSALLARLDELYTSATTA
jgi:multiple sugar transport system substrate-binding protein